MRGSLYFENDRSYSLSRKACKALSTKDELAVLDLVWMENVLFMDQTLGELE